jgi:hypothetical protein
VNLNTVLRLFFIFILSGILTACASRKIGSKHEARLHAEAKKKWGIITAKQYQVELKDIASSSLPDEPSHPLNVATIEKKYKKEASEWPVSAWAPINRDFNEGRISEATYESRHRFAGLMVFAVLNQGSNSGPTPFYGAPALFAPTTAFTPTTTASSAETRKSSYAGVPGTSFDSSSRRYSPNSLANPYGAGSPYKPDGLMNPYSQYGSPYSNKSWTNPYATQAPKLYDNQGNYMGNFSSNKYDPNSVSNPYGKFGNPYSPSSINNPYGAGNPYSNKPVYVVPQR